MNVPSSLGVYSGNPSFRVPHFSHFPACGSFLIGVLILVPDFYIVWGGEIPKMLLPKGSFTFCNYPVTTKNYHFPVVSESETTTELPGYLERPL